MWMANAIWHFTFLATQVALHWPLIHSFTNTIIHQLLPCRAQPLLPHWGQLRGKCLAQGHNKGLEGSRIWTATLPAESQSGLVTRWPGEGPHSPAWDQPVAQLFLLDPPGVSPRFNQQQQSFCHQLWFIDSLRLNQHPVLSPATSSLSSPALPPLCIEIEALGGPL